MSFNKFIELYNHHSQDMEQSIAPQNFLCCPFYNFFVVKIFSKSNV